MALSPGSRLGSFEIISLLGAGGMGEVYQAKDTRLERIVAIKILSSRISASPQMKQRFEREARSISSLSHPHICALYDVGHEADIDFLVMEYIEGETLAARLAKGALPVKEVLRYGMEIADALDSAHRREIIHRDLKPSNIMLTKSGTKLLDFGLAKLRETDPTELPGDLALPTKSRELTAEGTVIGTLQYMSPEQLEGKDIDQRTDIFSLGTVLYEMATGRKAFTGKSASSLISAILKSDPEPISATQPLSPSALDNVVQVCLAKDPDDRWQTAHDFALQLRWIAEGTTVSTRATRRSRTRAATYRILSTLLLLTTLILAFTNYHFIQILRATKESEVQKLSVLTPENTSIDSLAVSPDGRRVAFATANKEGQTKLWLRALDSLNAQPLPETEGALLPFWSPDSRFIAFFAQGKLKKIAVAGGPPVALCDVPSLNPKGGTWNQAGVILFARSGTDRLYRVDSAGGDPVPATTLDAKRGDNGNLWPYFLPDGRHFLYLVDADGAENFGIYVGSLDSNEKRRVLPEYTRVEYAAPGYLLFVRQGRLMAVNFDLNHFQINGNAFAIPENVGQRYDENRSLFSVSASDVLAYAGPQKLNAQFLWFDRKGKQLALTGLAPGSEVPSFSANEKRLVANKDGDLWIYELSQSTISRFTFEPSDEYCSKWSPDGKRIVFNSDRSPCCGLYQKLSDGSGNIEPLLRTKTWSWPDDWSPDGRYLLYGNRNKETNFDMWVLPLFGDRKPTPFLQTNFAEGVGQFSPNGKWVAYQSDETGRYEVYVRGFPAAAGGQWQISTEGGSFPRWRRDGKELLYLAPDRKIMSVQVQTEPTFQAGIPEPLFDTHVPSFPGALAAPPEFTATADGQRFLVNTVPEQLPLSPITVVLNWKTLLKR